MSTQATLCQMGTLFLPIRRQRPQFSAHVYCGQTAAWIKMKVGMGVIWGLSPDHIVLDGDPAHPTRKTAVHLPPIFSPCLYCGKTAGWTKMPLRMEVGLGPGRIVLDGDPDPPKGHR